MRLMAGTLAYSHHTTPHRKGTLAGARPGAPTSPVPRRAAVSDQGSCREVVQKSERSQGRYDDRSSASVLQPQPVVPDTQRQRMPEPLPAMTVTIEVNGGPTVSLTYDGGGSHRPIMNHTSVLVRSPAAPMPPRWLRHLLQHAAALLLLSALDEEHWPIDLRSTGTEQEGA